MERMDDSLNLDLAERLRADLLGAVLAPASRLRLAELTYRYSAPPGKIREVLLQLASQGLITFKPKHGFSALPVSLEELRDVTRMRIELEARALREAIETGDDDWEGEIVTSLHLLDKIEARSLKDRGALDMEWSRKHRRFHTALLAACRSVWTLRFCETLSDHAERYRRLSIATRPRERDIHAEHEGIAEAVLSGKADRACKLLAAHYSATSDAVASNEKLFNTADGE